MKKLLLVLILITSQILVAQNDEAYVTDLVAQKIAGLKLQGNAMFFSRKDYCEGNVQMFTMPDGSFCTSKATYYSVYVFWQEEGDVIKVQKFDNCGSFKPITINGQKILKFLKSNSDELYSQEVKPYKNEKSEQDEFANMAVKSCTKEYYFSLNGKSFEKSFTELDLNTSSKYKNENAGYNKGLELTSLDKDITKFIDNFENRGRFIREN
ncbi:hypothetical protein [Aequorivita marina]|uniref:hypothetical protein n=1 Tax=Aequorivita marina TaxID=3073654 RepID=UPI0028752FC2|nr:hypothetical protein [Aequorivita sp. S2608]MDS1298636.1 hypothetical protein [Aequorivita sp. S2608]